MLRIAMMFVSRTSRPCLILYFLATPIFGQRPILKEYLERIDRHHPGLASMQLELEAAQTRADVADTLPDPELSVGLFLEPIETRVGPQEQRLSLSQSLPWKGKRHLLRVRDQAMVERSRAALNQTRRELHRSFIKLYADYYVIGKSIASSESHLQLLNDLQEVVRVNYQSGSTPYASLIRIEVESDRLQDRLITLHQMAEPLLTRMNLLMDQTADDAIPFPASIPALSYGSTPNFSRNPELDQLDHLYESKVAATELARLNGKPNFNVGIDWIRTGGAVNPNMPGSGDDALMVRAGINLPIWRKTIRARQQAAQLEAEAVQYQMAAVTNNLTSQWVRAIFDRDDAKRKIVLYRDTIIPKATESLSVLQAAFQSNRANYLDVIDAERMLLEFNLTLHQSEADQLRAESELRYLAGATGHTAEVIHE